MSKLTQLDVRAWLMTAVALVLITYEAIFRTAERPFLLTLYASMLGMPIAISRDIKRNNGQSTTEPGKQ